MTLCIWKCPERCLIYVCIRCKFYYGTQGGLWDFPLNTWLPWSNPISLIQTRGRKIEGVKKEELKEMYNPDIEFSTIKSTRGGGANYILPLGWYTVSDQEPVRSAAETSVFHICAHMYQYVQELEKGVKACVKGSYRCCSYQSNFPKWHKYNWIYESVSFKSVSMCIWGARCFPATTVRNSN